MKKLRNAWVKADTMNRAMFTRYEQKRAAGKLTKDDLEPKKVNKTAM